MAWAADFRNFPLENGNTREARYSAKSYRTVLEIVVGNTSPTILQVKCSAMPEPNGFRLAVVDVLFPWNIHNGRDAEIIFTTVKNTLIPFIKNRGIGAGPLDSYQDRYPWKPNDPLVVERCYLQLSPEMSDVAVAECVKAAVLHAEKTDRAFRKFVRGGTFGRSRLHDAAFRTMHEPPCPLFELRNKGFVSPCE